MTTSIDFATDFTTQICKLHDLRPVTEVKKMYHTQIIPCFLRSQNTTKCMYIVSYRTPHHYRACMYTCYISKNRIEKENGTCNMNKIQKEWHGTSTGYNESKNYSELNWVSIPLLFLPNAPRKPSKSTRTHPHTDSQITTVTIHTRPRLETLSPRP